MKKILFSTIVLGSLLMGCNAPQKTQWEPAPAIDTTDATNDFYDNEQTHNLSGNPLELSGECAQTGSIHLQDYPLHTVIVKEAKLKDESTQFVGAYRYDGVSLYDILNTHVLQKKNAEDFPPIIDAFIEISNDQGDKIVLSWGEVFYPIHRHEIIIATRVMQIVPSKTKEYWPLPTQQKLIVGTDLITERNIDNPSKIVVKSLNNHFEINRNLSPLFAPELKIFKENTCLETLKELPMGSPQSKYPNIFYGRGRGIHGVTPFKGGQLKNVLGSYFSINQKNLRNGMFVIAALDGYRAAFTYSEVMNRNDQSEVLLIDKDNYEGAGRFSLYAAGDFFSDRAIKAVKEIHFQYE